MSNVAIRAALEIRLATIVPVIPTAPENAPFSPTTGPYQKINMLRAQPVTPTMDTFRRELGMMQVTLFYPINAGPHDAETRAELIRATFPKGLRLTNSGVNITIYSSAYIMNGLPDGNSWMLPVRIPYFANIS